jgi:hypothetical protein
LKARKKISSFSSKAGKEGEFSHRDGQPFVLFRPSSDWTVPTHIMEGNHLYSVLLNISSKKSFPETPRIMFDRLSVLLMAQSS